LGACLAGRAACGLSKKQFQHQLPSLGSGCKGNTIFILFTIYFVWAPSAWSSPFKWYPSPASICPALCGELQKSAAKELFLVALSRGQHIPPAQGRIIRFPARPAGGRRGAE